MKKILAGTGIQTHDLYIKLFNRPHGDPMDSPSSASSSLLSYDRTSLKFEASLGGDKTYSDSVSVSSAPGNWLLILHILVPLLYRFI